MNNSIIPKKLIILTLFYLFIGFIGSTASATVLFLDNFESQQLSSEWESRFPSNLWVQNGWLHVKNNDDWWPRDAMALVHDGNTSWTNYSYSVTADIVSSPEMQHFNILFRTDDFSRYSDSSTGNGYELSFYNLGSLISDTGPSISLARYNNGIRITLLKQTWEFSDNPTNIKVNAFGDHIQIFQDSRIIFDFVDPSPILYGGIGVHTIWEAESRFDNILVTVPLPASLWLIGIGFMGMWKVNRKV